MSLRRPHLQKQRWSQPLREDEIAPLVENLLHASSAVAKQALRAVVRLSLTPRAWLRVASNAQHLLERASTFGDESHQEILVNAARVPNTSIRAALLRKLGDGLGNLPRRQLLFALAREREVGVIPFLIAELRDADLTIRMAAARDLSIFPRLEESAIWDYLAGEGDPPTRFWLALTIAIGGNSRYLLEFFREKLPAGRYDWGTFIAIDDTAYFVLRERAERLPEDIRRAIGSLPISSEDPMKELQSVIEMAEIDEVAAADDGRQAPSDADVAAAELAVRSWITSEPEWQSQAQAWWDGREVVPFSSLENTFSRVDRRLRGRAVSRLFELQFARMRDDFDKEPFLHGRPDDILISDGGEIMALFVGFIIEGAAGIDVTKLFQLYWENVHARVYPGIQLAAAASYSTPRDVLLATAEALRSALPEQRRAAAEFIELTRQYEASGIPTWGGEGLLSDVGSTLEAVDTERTETLFYDPILRAPTTVCPKQRVRIVVDLLPAAGSGADVRLDDVSPGWDSLIIDVSVVAGGLRIPVDRETGTIIVYRHYPSSPFEVEGEAEPLEGQTTIQVVALFSFRGRSCGWARANISIGVDTQHSSRPISPAFAGHVEVAIEARVPPLTLRFVRGDGEDVYTYDILTPEELRDIPGMPERTCGTTRLRGEEGKGVGTTLDRIASTMTPDQAMGALRGVADLLYDQFPLAFREAYSAIRARLGDEFAIQFITEDPGVPWELARPVFNGSRTNSLCETHPVARWHPYQQSPLRTKLRKDGTILTVAPKYSGKSKLRDAAEEAVWIIEHFKAKRLRPLSRTALLNSFRKTPLSVLHIAAHGSFNKDMPLMSKLMLGGAKKEYVTAAEVRGEQKEALANGLVILNVCEAGAASGHLGRAVVGLAESFVERGAAAVIAPLWSVGDASAFDMLKRCLPRMLDGSPIAVVLRDARHADYVSIHPLAYILWGDVTASFT